MVAHQAPVSSLAIDPSGIYLASTDHGLSVRFWEISSKNCVQEITVRWPLCVSCRVVSCRVVGRVVCVVCAKRVSLVVSCVQSHRQKYDEGIYCVDFHPRLDLLATGGADACIKVYQ
jgi:striatin 1/3/4